MTDLVIHMKRDNSSCAVCFLCNEKAVRADGPQLFLADGISAVCRDCGKKHSPSLTALLDLASTAARVGRIGRHTLSPPLAALLDLARAAEDYTDKTERRVQRAA